MRSRLGLAAIVSVLFALPAGAHHSHGNYVDSFTDITGVVKEVHLLLPHSWVYVEVKDPKGGEAQIWALEATGRNGLERIGVTKEYVAPGDTIKARCHVLRDDNLSAARATLAYHSGARRRQARTSAAVAGDGNRNDGQQRRSCARR